MKVFFACIATVIIAALFGCGSGSDCAFNFLPDPAGAWSGTLTQIESDCLPADSLGKSVAADHEVIAFCQYDADGESDSHVELVDENGRMYHEISLNAFGGGSFSVETSKQSDGAVRTLSYENFDGELADVTLKVRNYRDDKITCSERFVGQLRKSK